MSRLTDVDIMIETVNPGSGDDTIKVRIRELTISGTVLISVSQLVSDGFDGWMRFPILNIKLTPGSLYVIEVSATRDTFGWGGTTSSDVYAGRAIVGGTPDSQFDNAFRTLSLMEYERPRDIIGGEAYMVNEFMVLAPYVSITLMIFIGSILTIIKHRK